MRGLSTRSKARGGRRRRKYGWPILVIVANILTLEGLGLGDHFMKTTVDIADALFERAKRHAKQTGRPMRALVEEGLRRVLRQESAVARYVLPDRSVGS